MRNSLSSLLAWALLASFLAGGVAAPTLHRVHHAQEQETARQAAPRCTHEEHAAPAFEQGRAQIDFERCWVLARHVLDVPAAPENGSPPPRRETTLGASTSALHTSLLERRVVIRGPPIRA